MRGSAPTGARLSPGHQVHPHHRVHAPGDLEAAAHLSEGGVALSEGSFAFGKLRAQLRDPRLALAVGARLLRRHRDPPVRGTDLLLTVVEGHAARPGGSSTASTSAPPGGNGTPKRRATRATAIRVTGRVTAPA